MVCEQICSCGDDGILGFFGSHTFVPISLMCKKQIPVSHSSTETEIVSLDSGLRMDGFPISIFGIQWLKYFIPHQTNKTKDAREPRRNLSAKHELNMRRQIPTPNTNLDLTNFDLVPSSGTHSGSNATLFVFEDKPWLRWLSKAEVPQWDMCQEPTELLWVGCLTGLILILEFRFDTFDTKHINSQTFWPKVISHVTNGIIYFICSTSAIWALLAALRIPAW